MNAMTSIAAITAGSSPINPLADRAMLVGVKLSMWTGRKLDKEATDKVNKDHEAADDAGRYNKALIAKDSLKRIVKATNDARAAHYERTLPWEDEGLRILPAAAYEMYQNDMRRARTEFEAAVDEFATLYPALKLEAARRLGGLYKADEFPDISRIRERFSFSVRVLPMPDANDFRVTLGSGNVDKIRADIEASMQQALEFAMKDAWTRIIDKVGHVADRLTKYKPGSEGVRAEGTFRDSLIENVKDLVAILPTFNLTSDPVLEKTIERMRNELCTVTPSLLRDDEVVRGETAAAAQSILDMVQDYLA